MRKHLLKRRSCFLISVLCLVALSHAIARQYAIEPPTISMDMSKSLINLQLKEKPFKQVAKALESATGFYFAYNNRLENLPITVSVKNSSLEATLLDLSRDYGLHFKQVNNTIHVVQTEHKPVKVKDVKEERAISGVVMDEHGITIPGANVIEIGTTNGIATNIDGEFSLTLITTNPRILVSFVGYKSKEVEIGNAERYEIVLEEDSEALEEVVVVGFGEQKKVSLVGSQSTIRPKELKLRGRSLTNALGGRLAGIVSVRRSGEPGYDGSEIFIRGISTFGSSPRGPLMIVDGVPDRSINDINPEDIESFTILKDASATAVYGARGANGVIIINTKAGQAGKPQITVELNQAVTRFSQLPDFVDAPDFMRLYNEGLEMRGRTPQYSEEQIQKHISGEDPD